jgi:hypothetical protein
MDPRNWDNSTQAFDRMRRVYVSVNQQPSWVLRTALIAGMSVLTLVVLLIIIPALIVGALVFFALMTLHRIRLALFGAGAPRERNQRRNVIVIRRDSDRT